VFKKFVEIKAFLFFSRCAKTTSSIGPLSTDIRLTTSLTKVAYDASYHKDVGISSGRSGLGDCKRKQSLRLLCTDIRSRLPCHTCMTVYTVSTTQVHNRDVVHSKQYCQNRCHNRQRMQRNSCIMSEV